MQYNCVPLHVWGPPTTHTAERPAARASAQSPSDITSLSRFSSTVAIVLYKADRKV
jgi:hypothetical protein